MKKLIYPIFFGLFLIISACQAVNSSVKVLSKCCKGLSVVKGENKTEDENKESEYSKASSLLPINSWDGKMMIW